jgi:hypothetical protein
MAKESITTFEKVDLIANAQQTFGVMPEVLKGALYDAPELLTLEDAKVRLANFLKRPIK